MRPEEFDGLVKAVKPRPIYLFTGGERYLKERMIDAVRRVMGGGDPAAVRRLNYYAPETSLRRVIDEALAATFFDPSRLLILYGIGQPSADDTAAVRRYVAEPPAQTSVVITSDGPAERASLAKAMGTQGETVPFRPPYERYGPGWVRFLAKERKMRIQSDAASALLERCGTDLGALAMEMEKLECYLGEAKTIDVAAVEALVGRSRSRSGFELCEAISRRDAQRALEILRTLLVEGERPHGLVGLIRWQLNRLWKARDMLDRGVAEDKIASALGLHRFLRDRFFALVRTFSQGELRRSLSICFEADLNLRSTRWDEAEAVEVAVVQLCGAPATVRTTGAGPAALGRGRRPVPPGVTSSGPRCSV